MGGLVRLQAVVEARAVARLSSDQLDGWQRERLADLLRWAWRHSPFYSRRYRSLGLREAGLDQVKISDLPLLDKDTLTSQFDQVVTDGRLRRRELEKWVHLDGDPRHRYLDEFVVVNTSGSTGRKGMFVSRPEQWEHAAATAATRLPPSVTAAGSATRRAFYLHSSGHFAGITTALCTNHEPRRTLFVPLFESPQKAARAIADFRAQIVSGYANRTVELAEACRRARPGYRPEAVFISGDSLTDRQRETLRAVWPGARLVEFYSASEAPFMAVRGDGASVYTVLDGLVILEVVDRFGRAVGEGESGEVVVTNLVNRVHPLIRYRIGDRAVRGPRSTHGPWSTLTRIQGKIADSVPVIDGRGNRAHLTSHMLNLLFVPGLVRCQVVVHGSTRFRVDYEADVELDRPLAAQIRDLLAAVGAADAPFSVRRVARIALDPDTGKFRQVVHRRSP